MEAAQEREIELENRLSGMVIRENALREKVVASEVEYSDKLRIAAVREKDLQDQLQQMSDQFEELKMQHSTRVSDLTRQLEKIQKESEAKELDLTEQLNSVREESAAVLRSVSWNGTDSSASQSSSLSRSGNLHVEVESLRSVLELKLNEISELRKQNQILSRSEERNSGLYTKISGLESKVEDLQFQLKSKTEHER